MFAYLLRYVYRKKTSFAFAIHLFRCPLGKKDYRVCNFFCAKNIINFVYSRLERLDSKIRIPRKRKVAWSVSSLYTCSITRFSDFPTAMFLSKTATCGTLTFEPSKTTKSDNALWVQGCYGFEGLCWFCVWVRLDLYYKVQKRNLENTLLATDLDSKYLQFVVQLWNYK